MNRNHYLILLLVALFGPFAAFALPTPEQLARESQYGYDFTAKHAPQGFLALFGGSRLKPESAEYKVAYEIGEKWTRRHGNVIPMGEGGGPGAMLAVREGAVAGGGLAISYTVPYPNEKPSSVPHLLCEFTDNGLREAALVDWARGYLAVVGGSGTHWEGAEGLTKILEKKVFPEHFTIVDVSQKGDWDKTLAWLKAVLGKNFDRVTVVHTADEAIEAAEKDAFHALFDLSKLAQPLKAADLRKLEARVDLLAPEGYMAVIGESPEGAIARVGQFGRVFHPHEDEVTLEMDPIFIARAKAIYAYPGDIRTHWQLMSAIDRIAHHQQPAIPIYLMGTAEQWGPFLTMLKNLEDNGTSVKGISKLITVVPDDFEGLMMCNFRGLVIPSKSHRGLSWSFPAPRAR